MADKPYLLWDLPTRVSHWLLVVCIPLAWWTAEEQNYSLHQWLGCTVIVLVCARLAWGVVGSPHSRFSDFLVGPARLLAYLRGQGSGSAGHNPLGGLSVVALLGVLLTQGISGLFNSDDVLFTGPLYYAVGTTFRDTMGQVHALAFNLLLALVGLHIAAVGYHQLRRREPLLQAMLRGRAPGREGRSAPVRLWRYGLVILLVVLALWAVLAWAPEPPPMFW